MIAIIIFHIFPIGFCYFLVSANRMDSEYLTKTLKRIYDECQRAQDDDDEQSVGKTLIKNFNELLEQFKSEYPQQDVIQSIDTVETSGAYGRAHHQDVQQVKLNALKIADSLGLDTEDFRQDSPSDNLATINIRQEQSVNQTVDVDTLIKQVDNRMMSEPDKEELKKIIQDYEEELDSNSPDKSTLEELIDKAREKSPDIALKLGMAGLEKGIDLLA